MTSLSSDPVSRPFDLVASQKQALRLSLCPPSVNLPDKPIPSGDRKFIHLTDVDTRTTNLTISSVLADLTCSLDDVRSALLPLSSDQIAASFTSLVRIYPSLISSNVHPDVQAAWREFPNKPSRICPSYPPDAQDDYHLQWLQFIERLNLLAVVDYRFAMADYIYKKERLSRVPFFFEIWENEEYWRTYDSLFRRLVPLQVRYDAARKTVEKFV